MNMDAANEKKIWDILKRYFGNDYAAAGFMGNMMADSNLIPSNGQAAKFLDLSNKKHFVNNELGFGICNWTWWAAKQGLWNLSKDKDHADPRKLFDLEFQLNFLIDDLYCLSYESMVKMLKNAQYVEEAATLVYDNYEKDNNWNRDEVVLGQRIRYAQNFYEKYALSKALKRFAYITSERTVYARKKPSLLSPRTGAAFNGSYYEVVEETENGRWYRICIGDEQGWIPARRCEICEKPGGNE